MNLPLRPASFACWRASGSVSAKPRAITRGDDLPVPAVIAARHNAELNTGVCIVGVPHESHLPSLRVSKKIKNRFAYIGTDANGLGCPENDKTRERFQFKGRVSCRTYSEVVALICQFAHDVEPGCKKS
jgi:hypothetical protein